jgi:uncharacterized protein DUF6899
MPYVKSEKRGGLDAGDVAKEAGELNYVITKKIDDYLNYKKRKDDRIGYSHLNEVIGVLECAKLELYRRLAADYEDKKKEENGDVYTVKPG